MGGLLLTSALGSSGSEQHSSKSKCPVSEPNRYDSYYHVKRWLVKYEQPKGRPDWPCSGEWWQGPVEVSKYAIQWPLDYIHNANSGHRHRPEYPILSRQCPGQSARIDALIRRDPQNAECYRNDQLPREMFWQLFFATCTEEAYQSKGVMLYCSDSEPPTSGSQWYVSEEDREGEWGLTPVKLSLSLVSEAPHDVQPMQQQELARPP